ncbi:MAG: sialate O-acetylesterase [Candidatus Sumerlaeota bacterium]
MRIILSRERILLAASILLFSAFFIAAPRPAPAQADLVDGVEAYQVFPAGETRGRITFRAKVKGSLEAYVARSDDATPVVSQRWQIDDSAPTIDKVQAGGGVYRTSSRDLSIGDVPIGGQYDVIFEQNGKRQHISPVSVGQVWIVGGGENAMGAPARYISRPRENVTVFRPDKGWGEGIEPLFPEARGAESDETMVSPWLRAAQDFYGATGIPVGLVAWAKPKLKMEEIFGENRGRYTGDFEKIVKNAAQNANLFCWYQGEADANRFGLLEYQANLQNMARMVRDWTGNRKTRILIIQTGRYLDPDAGRTTPWFGRIRHQQFAFAEKDIRTIIIPSMQFSIRSDSTHLLDADGVRLLSQDITGALNTWQKSPNMLWYGPRPRVARFDGSSNRRIKLDFDTEDPFIDLPDELNRSFLVKDKGHLGYPEVIAFGVKDNILALQVENFDGVSMNSGSGKDMILLELKNTGFLDVQSARIQGRSAILDITAPVDGKSGVLFYGLMDDSEAILRDREGRYVPAFGEMNIR